MKSLINFSLLIFYLLLTACSSVTEVQDGPPARKIDPAKIPNAVPKALPRSQYGNPSSYVVFGKRYVVKKSAQGFVERGIASWYGTKFHGRKTSSGAPYNMFAMTAAMRTLPLPTFVEVTDLKNNRHVIVEVNDRGPFADNRIIDLSYAAAAKLHMLQYGTALVEVRAIDPVTWNKEKNRRFHPKPKLEHPGKPQLYLQVGAFADKSNAEQILHRLQVAILQPSRVETITEKGHPVYRVQVGPLANVDISDLVTKRLIKTGFGEPMTIIE